MGETTSDGEAVTTLGTACADDRTAATGLHADQEAMGALAADNGGLISAFHVGLPVLGQTRELNG